MNRSEGLTIGELMKVINCAPKELVCFERLGYLNIDRKKDYEKAYNYFKDVNSEECLNGTDKKDDNSIKGKALEDLVSILFSCTGEYFEIYRNLKNGSNEADLFVKYSGKGQAVAPILGSNYSKLICECKNYKGGVDVTYVGKFYSLMQTTYNNVGVMFSYCGFSGKSWGGASGLTKKLFMLKEHPNEKIYILDFNHKDFKAILDGKSFFDILDDKCRSLELGIDDINKYIKKHPNEDKWQ